MRALFFAARWNPSPRGITHKDRQQEHNGQEAA
jgi:hypothetical protein